MILNRLYIIAISSLLFQSALFIKGQQISTVAEIYDFEVGDIFHFESWWAIEDHEFQNQFIYVISDKYYSSSNDTVFYIKDFIGAITGIIGNDTTWTCDTGMVIAYHTDLNSLIHGGEIYQVYYNPNLYNGRKINYYDTWSFDLDEEYMFVDGCGWAYMYKNEWLGSDYMEEECSLVYFKKGEEEWGTPLNLYTRTEEIRLYPEIIIYPNPANDWLYIKQTNFNYNIELRNLYGQVVKEVKNIQSSHYAVNVSDLKTGVYFYVIKDGDKVLQQGKVVVK